MWALLEDLGSFHFSPLGQYAIKWLYLSIKKNQTKNIRGKLISYKVRFKSASSETKLD